jgi:hypothetical protein
MSAAQAKVSQTAKIIHPEDGKPWWKFAMSGLSSPAR